MSVQMKNFKKILAYEKAGRYIPDFIANREKQSIDRLPLEGIQIIPPLFI